MVWSIDDRGFLLTVALSESDLAVSMSLAYEHVAAQKPQGENVRRQLSKLGDTVFECVSIEFGSEADAYFVPSSFLADTRRKAVVLLEKALQERMNETACVQKEFVAASPGKLVYVPAYTAHPYMYNVSNGLARAFYERQGMRDVVPAFELDAQVPSKLLMQCRHCLRYEFGGCVKNGGRNKERATPSYLRLADGRRFRLEYDCKQCQMNIYAED